MKMKKKRYFNIVQDARLSRGLLGATELGVACRSALLLLGSRSTGVAALDELQQLIDAAGIQ